MINKLKLKHMEFFLDRHKYAPELNRLFLLNNGKKIELKQNMFLYDFKHFTTCNISYKDMIQEIRKFYNPSKNRKGFKISFQDENNNIINFVGLNEYPNILNQIRSYKKLYPLRNLIKFSSYFI